MLASPSDKRDEFDFYPTPDKAILDLFDKFEKYNIKFDSAWECACGDGAISKLLESVYNINVTSTDLIDRGFGQSGVDFLKTDTLYSPHIITNPPFKIMKEFAEHALEDLNCKTLTLFGRLMFLEGQKRKKFFLKYPPKYVFVFSYRVPFKRGGTDGGKGGGGVIPFAWYHWDTSYNAETVVDWI